MSHRVTGSMIALAAVALVWSIAPARAAAQRPAAAKTWNPSRTPDGKPDLQGFWEPVIEGTYSIEDLELENILQRPVQGRPPDEGRKGKSRIVDPPDGKIPYQSWALAKRNEIFDHHLSPNTEQVDPEARCFLTGVPRAMYQPNFIQILRHDGYLLMLYELNHTPRIISMNGRPHPGRNIKLWMGDSRGHWEGDTLVVDTANFNGGMWFDMIGDFQSDTMHTVERFTLVDPDTIDDKITIENPTLYTRPWTMVIRIARVKEAAFELMESACHEGEQDSQRILRR